MQSKIYLLTNLEIENWKRILEITNFQSAWL